MHKNSNQNIANKRRKKMPLGRSGLNTAAGVFVLQSKLCNPCNISHMNTERKTLQQTKVHLTRHNMVKEIATRSELNCSRPTSKPIKL